MYVTDHGKLTRDSGWSPQITVRQTLERIHDWWKRNREVFGPIPMPERVVAAGWQELPGAA